MFTECTCVQEHCTWGSNRVSRTLTKINARELDFAERGR